MAEKKSTSSAKDFGEIVAGKRGTAADMCAQAAALKKKKGPGMGKM